MKMPRMAGPVLVRICCACEGGNFISISKSKGMEGTSFLLCTSL